MKPQTFTYILSVLLFCCVSLTGYTDAYAQRARKHRERILTTDSIRAIHQRDSIQILNQKDTIVRDSIDLLQEERIAALEAPVDTAELARKNDSIQSAVPLPEKEKKRWIPNSNKTVWLGLVIPGAGQIYNRKYWKLPIIYGGFVGCAYALTWNGQMYKDYSQAYQDIMSNNPNNNSYEDFLPPGIDVHDRLDYYQELFRKRKDLYRRQRDLSIFVFIGVYLLSVIDAYVDAELSDFDISKDLTMTWQPTVFNDAFRNRPQGIGVQCCINF